MKTLFTCTFLFLASLSMQGQDYIESTSHNDAVRGTTRQLQYHPEGNEFVCINGKNKYTRALYGSHSAFRLETSDFPVFAAYDKTNSKNISFRLNIALDSVAHCESRYSAGKRTYLLKDPSWGKGEVHIIVYALPDENEEGAIWMFETKGMPQYKELKCKVSDIKQPNLLRNGDMGVDPPDCFDAASSPKNSETFILKFKGRPAYFLVKSQHGSIAKTTKEAEVIFHKAEKAALELNNRIIINTPDAYLNTLGGALTAAADGTWDGQTWLHGAIGWRMPLNGWRAGYIGDFLGWHDRARIHFDAYAASQVKNIPPIYQQPAQDTLMNLARSEKKWGTPMYSNGYICCTPGKTGRMNHYDMNLCYIDELLWHLNWTGDTAYAHKIWPVLTSHLAWEKRNFDADGDGLYDAYCCIWASDALYYNSGGVTHSSAYNYRANKMAALIARIIHEDPAPYEQEADRILKAINTQLWMKEKGVWAEFKDFMGLKRLHPNPALWTIYHSIDSDIASPEQAYTATRYIDEKIPHIPVVAKGLESGKYHIISTTNWLPYAWSINNVASAEVMHTALAYWQAGRYEEAVKLFKSSVLDGMYLGNSPGNVGQISFYDAARGECYRDFGDPAGVMSRAIVQGLFGITPDALNNRLLLRPGFPSSWKYASIHTPDIDFSYRRENDKETYSVNSRLEKACNIELLIPAWKDKISTIQSNGKALKWENEKHFIGRPFIRIFYTSTKNKQQVIEIEWKGNAPVIKEPDIETNTLNVESNITFKPVNQGMLSWMEPIEQQVKNETFSGGLKLLGGKTSHFIPIDISNSFNACVTDIFRNKYLSPRSPYTTLQIPTQGMGEWCHPQECDSICDEGIRKTINNGTLIMDIEGKKIPFFSAREGKNILFTSLWNNYPAKAEIPLKGKADGLYLMMAGSTNHMQCYMENARITVDYKDGTRSVLPLISPTNWCPIEQDYYVDGLAFKLETPRPYRFCLQNGIVSNDLGNVLKLKGPMERKIKGGAGIILCMPLDKTKELSSLQLETLSNDVVIGLMGATLVTE